MSEEEKANRKKIEKMKIEPETLDDSMKHPSTPGEIPAPYPDTSGVDESSAGKVKVNGKEIVGKGSDFETSEGDEAGTDGTSTPDLSKIGDSAEKVGSRLAEEARGILDYASNMGPEGYKLLIITFIVGFLGGVLYQTNACNSRISALSGELNGMYNGMNGGLSVAPTNEFNPPNWDLETVTFDLEADNIMIQVLNRGPGALFFQSISVTKLPGDTTYIDTHEDDMMPLHIPGVGHINWTSQHSGAPNTFLEAGIAYKIKVTVGNGFWAIWQGEAK